MPPPQTPSRKRVHVDEPATATATPTKTPTKTQIIHISGDAFQKPQRTPRKPSTRTPSRTPSKLAAGRTPTRATATPSKSIAGPSLQTPIKTRHVAVPGSAERRKAAAGRRIVTLPTLPVEEEEEGEEEGAEDDFHDEDTDEDEDEDGEGESGAEETVPTTPSKRKNKIKEVTEGLIKQTSFDLYFQHINRISQTSHNVFSSLLPSLIHDEYTTLLRDSPTLSHTHVSEIAALDSRNRDKFPQFLFELSEGFNILLHGYGSKCALLNSFAQDVCAKKGHIVVVNGYFPSVGIKDILSSLDSLPALSSSAPPSTSPSSDLEAHARCISNVLLLPTKSKSQRPVFIIIHNIDSPKLRTRQSKTCLAILASCPNIHLIGSVDHINAALIWTTSESAARQHPTLSSSSSPSSSASPSAGSASSSIQGFSWLWHETPTFRPYDVELSFKDQTSLALTSNSKAGSGSGVASSSLNGPITEVGAQQVLASVTQKAKKLFLILGKKQMAAMSDDDSPAAAAGGEEVKRYAMQYDLLGSAAREEFIAVNDTALRSLLQEFRDHGLVVSSTAAAGGDGSWAAADHLWIPLKRAVLGRLLESWVVE